MSNSRGTSCLYKRCINNETRASENAEEHTNDHPNTVIILPSSEIGVPDNEVEILGNEDNEPEWMTHPLSLFLSKLSKNLTLETNLSKPVKKFYKRQDAQIISFQNACDEISGKSWTDNERNPQDKSVNLSELLSKVTLVVNLMLLVMKCVAVGLSGSLAIISALLDSIVDLVSGIIMWWASRAVKKRNRYQYPQGKTRIEPIAIIILAVIMGVVSVQIVIQAIQKIAKMVSENEKGPEMNNVTIIITCIIVLVKFILWMVCWKLGSSPSVAALALDHRNDVISNSVAVVCSTLSSRLQIDNLKYLDPVGAILIGLYILRSWYKTGREHTRSLTGYTATPEFLQKITFLTINHHPLIDRVDTVQAYHFGWNFLVEVHIVLPAEMGMIESHDIGESLQTKLEKLDEVERAFVHLDYEYSHHPDTEHKTV